VTRPTAHPTAHEPRAAVRGRAKRATPSRSTMLPRLIREAQEHLGPDATERQVAAAAERARKAFYARLSATGVAARKAALLEALTAQRRSATAFAQHDPRPGQRSPASGTFSAS
jgi:hypothetical protein